MQPYRVSVTNNNSKERHVLSAMLSNNDMKIYSIYIVEKHFKGCGLDNLQISDVVKDSESELAHAISTRNNSTIRARYQIRYAQDERGRRKYKIELASGPYKVNAVDGLNHTLQDCLRSAMTHYCNISNLTIERYL